MCNVNRVGKRYIVINESGLIENSQYSLKQKPKSPQNATVF